MIIHTAAKMLPHIKKNRVNINHLKTFQIIGQFA